MKTPRVLGAVALISTGILLGAGKCDSVTPCHAIIKDGGRGGIPRENSPECRDAEKRQVEKSKAAAATKAATKTRK